MIVVADASPLIFLAKIRQLDLVHALLGRDVRIPAQVEREVLAGGVDPAEKRTLVEFLDGCQVVKVPRPQRYALAMSRADNAAVTLAVRSGAEVLLCDDRLTRLMAKTEGVRPLGTLGVLLRAAKQGLVRPDSARQQLDLLVSAHGFHISVQLYQAALAELEKLR
jgi:uncharacterized protein